MSGSRGKQPYWVEINDGKLFVFARIWDRWNDASAKTFGDVLDPNDESRCGYIVGSRPNASRP
jgi:putative SOS response-associated peptidase YedK